MSVQSYTTDGTQALCDIERNGEPMRAIGINWPNELEDGAHVSTLLAIVRDRIGIFRDQNDPETDGYRQFNDAMGVLDDVIAFLGESGVTGG